MGKSTVTGEAGWAAIPRYVESEFDSGPVCLLPIPDPPPPDSFLPYFDKNEKAW